MENALDRMDADAPPDPAVPSRPFADGQTPPNATHDVSQKLVGRREITATITALCVALMVLAFVWGEGDVRAVLYQMGANARRAVAQGQAWRLLSSAFLHSSIPHLTMNMLALWGFGILLETVLGWRRYLLLYLLAALGGSVASAGLQSSMSVGASGAIWGLMSGGLALTLWPRGLLPAPMADQMRQRAWMPLICNVVYSLQPGVDFVAHIGGGIVGFLLVATVMTRGLVPANVRRTGREAESGPRIGLTAAAVGAVLATVLSLGMALADGRPWEWARPTASCRIQLPGTELSMSLPASLARAGKVSRDQDGTTVASYGDLRASPVAFEVVISQLDAPVVIGEIDEVLDTLRRVSDEEPTGRFTRSRPAKRVLLGSNPAILARFQGDGVNLDCYRLVVADKELLIRSYSRTNGPRAWSGVAEDVVESIGPR